MDTRAHEKWGPPPSGSRPSRSRSAMKLARGSRQRRPKMRMSLCFAFFRGPKAKLVFLGQFFKQSLIYSFISRQFLQMALLRRDGRARSLVIYLEWKSATASFPPSAPLRPSEKVKFGPPANLPAAAARHISLMKNVRCCCPG